MVLQVSREHQGLLQAQEQVQVQVLQELLDYQEIDIKRHQLQNLH
jgi:hypothetical protein